MIYPFFVYGGERGRVEIHVVNHKSSTGHLKRQFFSPKSHSRNNARKRPLRRKRLFQAGTRIETLHISQPTFEVRVRATFRSERVLKHFAAFIPTVSIWVNT